MQTLRLVPIVIRALRSPTRQCSAWEMARRIWLDDRYHRTGRGMCQGHSPT